VILSLLEVYTT